MRLIAGVIGFSVLLGTALPSLSISAETPRSMSTQTKGEATEANTSLIKRFLEFTTEQKDLGEDRLLSPIAAPFYAPETGAGFVLGGLLTQSLNPDNPDLPRSYLKVFGIAATRDTLGLRAVSELFYRNDTIRLNSDFIIRTATDDYYGVGYDNGQNVDDGENTTEYSKDTFFFTPELVYRAYGDLFVGVRYNVNWIDTSDEAELMQEDPAFNFYGDNYLNSGLGPVFIFDSRDMTSNAWSGSYAKFSATFYDEAIGSDYDYELYDFDLRHYLNLGREGRTLAMLAGLHLSDGDVPWSELPTVGGSHNLRGYNLGQYRDEASAYGVLEYRHQFLTDVGKLSRHGAVCWIGYGAVGESIDDFSGNGLPNVGVGYRYELQERMNLRLDLGAGDDSFGVYLKIQEAF